MISKEFFKAIDVLAEDRGLDKEKILKVMEKGLLNAFKKEHDNYQNARVIFNEEKSEIMIYQVFEVVEDKEDLDSPESFLTVEEAQAYKKNAKVGDVIEIKITPRDFGRIAATSAKQILTQELKQLEREKAYEIFKDKEDEMISATIIAINDEYITLNLGYDIETSVIRKEISNDDCFIGNTIKIYITKVEMTSKGPKVYVSRSDKNLIKRLFENYVPEVRDGIVEIIEVARDAGDRTKVCVSSNNDKVDPIGACLGARGRRIKEINDALGGEKIDVYLYSNDPKELIANALQPATTLGIIVNVKERQAVAVVDDSQLSLAIGKKGQNARLAVQSSGWKIDIKSASEADSLGINYHDQN